MQTGTRGFVVLLGFAVALCVSPGVVLADELSPAGSPSLHTSPAQDRPLQAVNIDQLLKLPTTYRVEDVRKRGLTKKEWRTRFVEVRSNLEEMERKLAEVRAELGESAGNASQWNVTPPGADVNAANNPTNFGLTQQLRRGREDVKDAEKRLTELDIEANLANVPEGWRL